MRRFALWTALLSLCLFQCFLQDYVIATLAPATSLYPSFVDNGTLHDKLNNFTVRDLEQSNHLIMYGGEADYSELWYCQRIDLVEYLDKRNAQTVVKFLKDPQCDIFEVEFSSKSVKEYGTLVKRLTTTTEPPTTPETTTAPPLPLEPLPIVVYVTVGCFCATCIIASIIICGISNVLRSRRFKKQEELFFIVLRRHYAEQRKLNASAGRGKDVGMLTQEAFMANVEKVMEEDKIKEEISAVGDEAATPETFVKFMSLEPLYRRSQTRELIENSSVTCADSVTTTTQTPSRKKPKEAKSKIRTADMIQPPSSDNEWLQLSNESMTPWVYDDGVKRKKKGIEEYNALSQSTWEERVGELDSLIKIIKADLKVHGIKLNASAQTTPTSDVQSWLQSTTSLHRFIADCSVVLSPTVFKLRYKEQMTFLEEQKLAALYRSALLSVEKQHRIAFLQMVFHKFALLQKTTKQAPSTIKRSHPYPLLDRLRHHFPEYFAVFAKSNEK
uniref:SAM domain-containing protein n=1 Tax=Panagrellus redivivus TaxID=6233 RepID=A0A7E4W7C6_PANRE